MFVCLFRRIQLVYQWNMQPFLKIIGESMEGVHNFSGTLLSRSRRDDIIFSHCLKSTDKAKLSNITWTKAAINRSQRCNKLKEKLENNEGNKESYLLKWTAKHGESVHREWIAWRIKCLQWRDFSETFILAKNQSHSLRI